MKNKTQSKKVVGKVKRQLGDVRAAPTKMTFKSDEKKKK